MRTHARWLRFLGLFLELTGVVGIVRERPGREMPRLTIPGGYSISWPWISLAVGFVIWLVATIILAATRFDGQNAGPGCSDVDENPPTRDGVVVNLDDVGDEPFGLARDDEKR